jgi:hypothetical protein
VVGRIRFALERFDLPRHSSHVAQLFSLGRLRAMSILRFILSVAAPLLAASVLGVACSMAWLARSDSICKLAVGVGIIAFALWPVCCSLVFIRLAAVRQTRLLFAVVIGLALLSVPVFGLALDSSVTWLTGHAANRNVWALVLAGGYASVLCGTLMAWQNLRRPL